MASEPPLILAFDTSAAHCAAALVRGEAVLARRDEAMDRGQAERLLPMLEELLAEAGAGWADVAALAVCTGPGNFTGLRLAVAAARGLALARDIPAVGVSRFEALAEAAGGDGLMLVEDRSGSLLAQPFRAGAALAEPRAWDPQATDARPVGPARADPATLAALAERRLSAGPVPRPAPLYVRPADAAPPAEAPPPILDDG